MKTVNQPSNKKHPPVAVATLSAQERMARKASKANRSALRERIAREFDAAEYGLNIRTWF